MHSVGPTLAPQPLQLVETPTPRATGPFDVVVRIAAAGVCRTDLHIVDGDLPVPSFPLGIGNRPRAINDAGDIAGNYWTGNYVGNGYWGGADHGGHLIGRIERAKK